MTIDLMLQSNEKKNYSNYSYFMNKHLNELLDISDISLNSNFVKNVSQIMGSILLLGVFNYFSFPFFIRATITIMDEIMSLLTSTYNSL